ncbi:MAG: pyruvate dehydrogenase (acetyl-transferring) E1 component subunit alpha [Alphaproteobacteria bacterium]
MKNKIDIFNNQSKKELLALYHDMLLIRRFEEKAGQLYGMGLIGGFCHLYIGQEAVVVGLNSVQQKQDSVVAAYREHGHMIACGMDPKGIMAELTGRIDGFSKGKGGSMHMFSREKNFFGGHGIVGASGSIGTGLAFAHQYTKDEGVAISYIGDGAANQGQVAESYNMAALWKLPVLYVIENNQYSMGTALKRHAINTRLYERGAPYEIPGELVDGMDVLAVQRAAKKALDYVRSGKGPYILQMETYRYRGHSMSDPAKYRTKDEVEKYKLDDPLTNLKNMILKEEMAKEADFEHIEDKVKEVVREAAEFAQASPEPEPSELYTDVLVEGA